jgi:hypothetical protein
MRNRGSKRPAGASEPDHTGAHSSDADATVPISLTPAGSVPVRSGTGGSSRLPSWLKFELRATPRRPDVLVGASPRANLLPPEIADAAVARRLGRRLVLAVAVVLVITGGGVGATYMVAANAQSNLAVEQAKMPLLVAQEGKYAKANNLEVALNTVKDAQTYGTSGEILWSKYVGLFSASLPSGTSVLTTTITSSAPWETPLLPAGPLRSARSATIVMQVVSNDPHGISTWVATLPSVAGYADSSIDTVTFAEGVYTSVVTIDVGAGALDRRYASSGSSGSGSSGSGSSASGASGSGTSASADNSATPAPSATADASGK